MDEFILFLEQDGRDKIVRGYVLGIILGVVVATTTVISYGRRGY